VILFLEYQSVDYQKAILSANNDTTDESWKKIIADIKDEYAHMKATLSPTFRQWTDGGQTSAPVQDPRSFDETKAIPGLPDYWNAENTSQRIVDFATSFLSALRAAGTDFLNTIKDAIDQGFSQAKDMFGRRSETQ